MPSHTVALVRCTDYTEPKITEAVKRQFELLGGLEKFVTRGDTVLLKPNFIAPRSARHATQTDPAIILAAARLLKDFGAKPFVGDSPAWANVFACVRKLRLQEPLRRLDVPVKQLNKPQKCRIEPLNINVGISSVALDADIIINLAKLKTHQQLTATFAVKNMFGCVSGKRKALWHFARGKSVSDFCELLIAVFKLLNPVLTIIDGVVAMDGQGPIRGRARPLGWIIGGADPIACEHTCCKLLNIAPRQIPIIKTARRMEFGCCNPETIKLLGDDFSEHVCTNFELPQLIPVRFSLLHVCKSVCKQIGLLTKQALRKIVLKEPPSK